jgi:cytochrome P450
VTDEVRGAFTSDREIDFLGVSKLPALIAVLTETLRIYPQTPGAFPRKTLAGGNVVDGRWVPPHTTVGIFQWASTHSPENFHNPDTFHPERCIPDPPKEYANDFKESMQPFSFDPRNCIGKNLAYVETRLIMTKILWHFDLVVVDDRHDWAEQKSYVIWAKGPLMVKVTLAPCKRQL